ncbi:hypothetical protein FB567DRAFT_633962 [Paraphoma chrysanthemicola]|uniref:Uncharacterized protein n=1 Tax=Paraphoma chrysanthemicola TaxID=798071 RepID=A0A8K0QTX6_9PLEO|nr:hypothetical protein FB567DRAFT_633962 [Paraphoma chrysanthemicola]
MVLYPDNPDRAQRARDLANDISFIQDAIIKIRDGMKKENEDAYELLEELAIKSGHLSLQGMIDKMKELLPESEKKRYEDLENKVKQQGKDVELSFQVISAVGAFGCFARLATGDFAWLCGQLVDLIHWISAIKAMIMAAANAAEGTGEVAGMVEMAEFALEQLREPRVPGDPALAGSGAEAAGSEVIEASADALQAAADSIAAGGELSADAARVAAEGASAAAESAIGIGGMALKGLRLFGNAMLLLSFLAAIGTIIADGVEGAKQRDELIDGIHELCAKRFVAEKLHLRAEGVRNLESRAIAIIFEKHSLQKFVEKGKMSQADADAGIAEETSDLVSKLLENYVIRDEDIKASLDALDKAPHYDHDDLKTVVEMRKWLDDHPGTDVK